MAKHFRAFGGTLFTLGCGYASKWCADQSDVNNESVGGLWFYCASVFFGVWVLWGWVFVMACVWESGRDVPDAMSGRQPVRRSVKWVPALSIEEFTGYSAKRRG